MLLSLLRLMLLMPLLAGFGVHAASMGEIDVSSHMGEPLRARVPISTDQSSLPSENCVRIVGPARHHPALADAKLSLVNQDGRSYISIATDQPIIDPVLDLTLQAEGCGLSMQKDFVILLSPRNDVAASGQAPIAAAITAVEPTRPALTNRAETIRHGDGATGKLTDPISQYRQVEQPATAGRDATPAPTDRPVRQTTAEAPDIPEALPPDHAGTIPQSPAPAAKPETVQPWYARLLKPFNLLLVVLPILAVLAIALWLKRRRLQNRYLNETTPVLNTLFPADQEIQLPQPPVREPPAAKLAPVNPPEPSPAKAAPPPQPPTEAMQHMMGIVVPPIEAEDFQANSQESFDHVMELAEVMLAFGRSGQAIETLSRHIHSNPRQAVDPWLKLLDLYHQSDLRTEFEALATDLHNHYNIAMPDWDGFTASPAADHEAGPLTLESLPHIMGRLTETWGSQDALDYLNKLLEDNRGGQRLGFSMALVRDILLLRDILRQSSPGSAFPH